MVDGMFSQNISVSTKVSTCLVKPAMFKLLFILFVIKLYACINIYQLEINTVQAEACNFIKKETPTQVFSCEYCEIFKGSFFIEHLWWLLLHFSEAGFESFFIEFNLRESKKQSYNAHKNKIR